MKINTNAEIGVLIVTFNQFQITYNFVVNFLKLFSTSKNIYLLILDNCSEDRTYELLKKNFPSIDIRRLNNNYGCVMGRNIGIFELMNIGCKYIYISDNDIVISDHEFFKKLHKYMNNNPEVDACCPIVRYKNNGKIQTLGRRKYFGYFKNLSRISKKKYIHTLPGCAQFHRKNNFYIFGMFDSDLSPYSLEDYEWGYRNFKKIRMTYFESCEVYHDSERNNLFGNQKIRFIIRGRVVFLKKYFSMTNIILEIKFILQQIIKNKFQVSFLLKSYLEFSSVEISKGNSLYSNFLKIDVNDFYCTDSDKNCSNSNFSKNHPFL